MQRISANYLCIASRSNFSTGYTEYENRQKNTWIMQFSRGLAQYTEYMYRTIELEDKHDSEDIRLTYSTLHVHIQYTLLVC